MVVRPYIGNLHAVGRGEGPCALVTPIKATRGEWGGGVVKSFITLE